MVGAEKTNNISIDQVAARMHGHKTRYPSLVLGTEGGTGSYGSCKTLSHRGPGRPIPSLHKPQQIFNQLFNPYTGKGVEQVRAGLKRDASILDLVLEHSRSFKNRLGKEDKGKVDEYLDSIRALEQRVERTSKWTHQPLPEVDTKGLNLEVSHKDPEEYIRCILRFREVARIHARTHLLFDGFRVALPSTREPASEPRACRSGT